MKKLIGLLFAFMLLFNVSAQEDIQVTINGTALASDSAPVMEGERVLVPMRAIFESLGAKVEWDGDTSTVFAFADNQVIILQIDSPNAFVNGESKELDVPARLVGERTMVPVRFVSEALGAEVNWDEQSNTVVITKQ